MTDDWLSNFVTEAVRMQAFGYSSRRMKQSRCGVTLIELAVVVAIVGVLASLILLAAMTLRRTSHDLQCRNHLRQLSLAERRS